MGWRARRNREGASCPAWERHLGEWRSRGKSYVLRRVFLGKNLSVDQASSRALPDVTARRANSAALRKSSATPLTTRAAAAFAMTMSSRGPGSPASREWMRFGVFLRRPASDGFERGAGNAEVFGRDGESPHAAVADFGDLGFAGEGNFVEAAGAVDNEGAMGAEFRESCRDGVDHVRGENAQDLRFGACRICQRAKKIKDGALCRFAGAQARRGALRRGPREQTESRCRSRARSGRRPSSADRCARRGLREHRRSRCGN